MNRIREHLHLPSSDMLHNQFHGGNAFPSQAAELLTSPVDKEKATSTLKTLITEKSGRLDTSISRLRSDVKQPDVFRSHCDTSAAVEEFDGKNKEFSGKAEAAMKNYEAEVKKWQDDYAIEGVETRLIEESVEELTETVLSSHKDFFTGRGHAKHIRQAMQQWKKWLAEEKKAKRTIRES